MAKSKPEVTKSMTRRRKPRFKMEKWIPPDERPKEKRPKIVVSAPSKPKSYYMSRMAQRTLRDMRRQKRRLLKAQEKKKKVWPIIQPPEPLTVRKWIPPDQRRKKKRKPIVVSPPGGDKTYYVPTMIRKYLRRKKPRVINPRPEIIKPPFSTRTWVPPYLRKKKKRKPAYVKPPGISQKLKISSLGKVWHKFQISDDRTILVGSFSETHKRFNLKSNGFQTPCNCMMAIAFVKFYEMPKWTTSTLDNILEMGDQLYVTSWNRQDDRKKTHMMLCEVYPSFFIENVKVTMCLRGTQYKGKLFDDSDDAPTLRKVIRKFFDDNHETAIISTQGKYLAFWFAGNAYYLFDPTEHTFRGYPWKGVPGRGVSMLMRFKETDALVDVVLENVDRKKSPSFVITPCFVIRTVKFDAEPPVECSSVIKPHCVDFKPSEFKIVPAKIPPKEEEPAEDEEVAEEEEEELVEVVESPETLFGEKEEIEEYSPELFKLSQPEDYAEEEGEEDEVTAKSARKDAMSKSKIPIQRAKAESVTYFTTLTAEKRGILRASTHQSDSRVTTLKGKQSVANAMAALTMLRIHKSRNWFKRILDDILKLGVTIHNDSVRALGPGEEIKTSTVCKRIRVEDLEFTPDVEEFTIGGVLQSPVNEIFDLLPALTEFFADNASCVITGPLTLAVWFEDGFFYMFDPNERDKNGMRIIKSIQVGSELQVLDYVPGVACVTWYKELRDLVEVYMANVDKVKRRDPFLVSRVQINDYVRLPDPWNKFQGLARGVWILRGTFNQRSRAFDKASRGTQCTTMAVAALAFSKIKHVKEWATEEVDAILEYGNTLYETCVANLKKNKKFVSPLLLVDEVDKKFVIEGREINLEIQDCLINGLLDAKDENDTYNLKKALKVFFKDDESGVVTSRGISVAVWKTDEIFYYFDSHSRDESGCKNDFGTACVMRFLNVDDLAKAIEANLGPGTDNFFNVNRVDAAIWEIQEAGVRPPLNNFTELSPTTAILRSLYHERSPIFKLNVGKQTVPMCLVSFAMLKLYPSAIWWRDIVDQILFVGDKLYTATMVQRENRGDLPQKDDIDEVYAENCLLDFQIGLNEFSLKYLAVSGGNFEYEFEGAMKKFFESKRAGMEVDQKELLVTSDFYTVAVWMDNGLYYLFDPRPRDDTGQIYGKEEWSAKYQEMEEEEGLDDYETNETYLARMNALGGGDQAPPQRRSVASQASEGGVINPEAIVKHSAHYWREHEMQGKACTMWFTTLEKITEHILENIPPNKREDVKFKLFPVTVTNKIAAKSIYDPNNPSTYVDYYSGNWYQFREIEYGRWILSGTMDCTHIMFPAHNRGKQSIAICFAVLAYVKRYAVSQFKDVTVNDILKYGDRLHSATRQIQYKEIKKNRDFPLSEAEIEAVLNSQTYGIYDIARAFCIGTDQMQLTVTPEVMAGDINALNMKEVYDVKWALEDYFAQNIYGILVCKTLTVAVWRGAKVYYMFDPNSRGPNGTICANGEACITRYLNLGVLADVFCKNLTKEGRNFFYIHHVAIKIVPCPREPKPEEKERPEPPKFNGYTMVTPGKSVLRGTMNLEDARFGRGKNVQCAPIAVIALTMTLVHKASLWTKPIIDDILILGDELYTATLDTLGFEFNPWEQGMTLHLVNKDYKVGTLRANCELRTMDQRGIIDIKHPKVLNIRQGIEKFFDENTHGVIETETLTVAIWEEDEQPGLIYMFDPYPRGPAGMAVPGGTACVVSFETAKMAADHFIANITDKYKRSGEFVITPVEIIVGNVKTKGKKAKKDPCAKESITSGAKKPSPTPAEKKRLRKMAEDEHRKKEAQRLARIGKFEYHVQSNGDAILRGSKSQTWKEYSENSQGKQDIPNCFSAFVVNRLVPIPHWHYKHIDMILDVGDQLYKDSYITYNPRDPKLGFANILRRVFIKEVRVSLKVYKPVMSNTLNQFNLEMALLNYFQQEQFGIISACNEHVAVFFKEGLYYMFDPHDRDVEGNKCESGCACVMKFQTLPAMVSKFLGNVTSIYESMGHFTITLVTVGNISKEGVPEGATSFKI